jgi:hypothetical protein
MTLQYLIIPKSYVYKLKNIFMTIQEVTQYEKEINSIELTLNKSIETITLEAFEKFYAEDVIIVEADGTTYTGKEQCRAMEQGFYKSIQVINAKDLLSSVVIQSIDPDYEFMVISTWYNNLVTAMYPIDANQTSIAYWKDGQIKKAVFAFPIEVIK